MPVVDVQSEEDVVLIPDAFQADKDEWRVDLKEVAGVETPPKK